MHLSSLALPSDMTSSCTVTSRREMCRISRRRGGYRCCVWAGRSARVWVTWPPCWTAWRNSCGTRTASLLDRPAAKHGRKQWLWSEHRTLEQEDENVHGVYLWATTMVMVIFWRLQCSEPLIWAVRYLDISICNDIFVYTGQYGLCCVCNEGHSGTIGNVRIWQTSYWNCLEHLCAGNFFFNSRIIFLSYYLSFCFVLYTLILLRLSSVNKDVCVM